MNAVNRSVSRLFDLFLGPLERFGVEWTLLIVGGVFGILALIAFKFISPQSAIRRAKDRIKGHLIEIRLYQDDLRLVTKAIGKVLICNLKYLGLNLAPFLPLTIPFALVAAQLVVRYGFDPVPVHQADVELLAGQGTTLEFEFVEGSQDAIGGLDVVLPDGLRVASPLVRVPSQGVAFQEVVAVHSGLHEIQIQAGGVESIKKMWAGSDLEMGQPRIPMQPVRLTGWSQILWPAEDGLGAEKPFLRMEFEYPERDLGWLPGSGPLGVLIWFVVASMVFGALVIKPLKVAI